MEAEVAERAGLVDKTEIRRLMDRVYADLGFKLDPNATAQEARARILAGGADPEDNSGSREIITERDRY